LYLTVGGGGGGCTVTEIDAAPAWACESLIVIGRYFAPIVTPLGTVARNEYVLSFAVASPFEWSSKNCCALDPPMAVRSPTTVLTGFEPGVTFTVSSVSRGTCRLSGCADPMPAGGMKADTVRPIDVVLLR